MIFEDKEDYKGLKTFVEWAYKNGYNDNLTLDRIDYNGKYCPENCRWIPLKIQANNTSCNTFIDFNRFHYTVSQWGRALGINSETLRNRISKGNFSIEEALTTPVDGQLIKAIHFIDEWGNPID